MVKIQAGKGGAQTAQAEPLWRSRIDRIEASSEDDWTSHPKQTKQNRAERPNPDLTTNNDINDINEIVLPLVGSGFRTAQFPK